MSGLFTALGSVLPTAGGGPITPPDVTGLTVWLKADALVLSDGDPVTTWLDSSGNGNTCGVTSNKPTYKTNIVNSLPVVRFNGTTNELVGDTNIGISQPNTVFFVVQKSGTAQGRLMDSTGRQLIDINATTNFAELYAGGGGGTAGTHSLASTFHVIAAIFDGAATRSWVDGAVDVVAAATAGTSGISTYYLGGDPSVTSLLAGDIAEFIVYNSALSTGNRQGIQNYLGTKYAITIS